MKLRLFLYFISRNFYVVNRNFKAMLLNQVWNFYLLFKFGWRFWSRSFYHDFLSYLLWVHFLSFVFNDFVLMNITERLFLEDPELKDVIPARFKSHKKIYEDAVRKGCLVLKKVRELQESGKGDMDMFTYVFSYKKKFVFHF